MESTHLCPWWYAYFFDNRLRRILHKPEVMLGPYVRQGMTVMDLGCGMGYFSIPLARMVGESGQVISVDIQEKMLEVLNRRAKRAGVRERIRTCLSGPQGLGVTEKVDFAFAMYMLHEVRDQEAFLNQVKACLKQDARFLVVEPGNHVDSAAFQKELEKVQGCGLKLIEQPRIRMSRTAVFSAEHP